MPHRIVVTGGAGFIGSHVADRLIGLGAEVIVIDDFSAGAQANVPAGAAVLRVDLATPQAVSALIDATADSIVHCAAQTSVPVSFDDPVRDAQSNIIGSLNVIAASQRTGVPLLYVTTGGALYGQPADNASDETAAIEPISPYGISKWTVETYMRLLLAPSRTTVLRLANVYGPRQRVTGEAGVVATFIDRMKRGLSIVIDGDGEQTRDMLYVADAVDAIEAVLIGRVSGSFNIGTGTATSVNALFTLLCHLTGYDRAPEFGPERVGDIRHSVLDPRLARRSFDWRARTSLVSGLIATLGQ